MRFLFHFPLYHRPSLNANLSVNLSDFATGQCEQVCRGVMPRTWTLKQNIPLFKCPKQCNKNSILASKLTQTKWKSVKGGQTVPAHSQRVLRFWDISITHIFFNKLLTFVDILIFSLFFTMQLFTPNLMTYIELLPEQFPFISWSDPYFLFKIFYWNREILLWARRRPAEQHHPLLFCQFKESKC